MTQWTPCLTTLLFLQIVDMCAYQSIYETQFYVRIFLDATVLPRILSAHFASQCKQLTLWSPVKTTLSKSDHCWNSTRLSHPDIAAFSGSSQVFVIPRLIIFTVTYSLNTTDYNLYIMSCQGLNLPLLIRKLTSRLLFSTSLKYANFMILWHIFLGVLSSFYGSTSKTILYIQIPRIIYFE